MRNEERRVLWYITLKAFDRSLSLCPPPFSICLVCVSQHRQLTVIGQKQGVTKRCRLSWLTNSALVYELKCGRMRGWGLRGLSQ